MGEESKLILAKVKWFGGTNSRTGRENEFGFAQTLKGKDVFIHASQVSYLSENQLILIQVEETPKGLSAISCIPHPIKTNLIDVLSALDAEDRKMDYRVGQIEQEIRTSVSVDHFSDLTLEEALSLLQQLFGAGEKTVGIGSDYGLGDHLDLEGEKLVQVLDHLISRSQIDDIPDVLSDYLLQLPMIFISRLEHFIDLAVNPQFREHFKSSYSQSDIKDSKVAEMLLETGLAEPSRFFSSLPLIRHFFNLLSNEDPSKTATAFCNAFRSYITNSDEGTLRDIFNTVGTRTNDLSFIEEIFTLERFRKSLDAGEDISLYPHALLSSNQKLLTEKLRLTPKYQHAELILDILDAQTVLELCFETGVEYSRLTTRKDIQNVINDFLENSPEIELPDVLSEQLKGLNHKDSDSVTSFLLNPKINNQLKALVGPRVSLSLLHDKNPISMWLYDEGYAGEKSIGNFVLFNLLPLMIKNPADVALSVFKHKLWKYLEDTQLNLDDSLMKLFPSCYSMGGDLSCEAVYWERSDMFLCRGRPCRDPQVIPHMDKLYESYTIYEWLKHYGVDYLEPDRPQNADFAHRLAGYFNRLKEIAEVLHCRQCNKVLVPNFKYARTTYLEFDVESKTYKEKSMSAAYRVTVFRCEDATCSLYGHDVYINHCIGWNCNSLIDSRDLQIQCDNNFYVCGACGACCEQHLQSYPPGLCPECGSPLNVFEGDGKRYVYCGSRQCDFKILSKHLPKRFTLPSMLVQIPGQFTPVHPHHGVKKRGDTIQQTDSNTEDPPLSLYDDMYGGDVPGDAEWGGEYPKEGPGEWSDDEPLPF